VGDPFLVTLADGVSMASLATLATSIVIGDVLVLRTVVLERGSSVGYHAVVEGGAVLKAYSRLGDLSLAPAGSTLAAMTAYSGVPCVSSRRVQSSDVCEPCFARCRVMSYDFFQLLGFYLMTLCQSASAAMAFYVALGTIEALFGAKVVFPLGYAASAVTLTFSSNLAPFLALFTITLSSFGVVESIWDTVSTSPFGVSKVLAIIFVFGLTYSGCFGVSVLVLRRLLLLPAKDRYCLYSWRHALRWACRYSMVITFDGFTSVLGGTVYFNWWLAANGAKVASEVRLNYNCISEPEQLDLGPRAFLGGRGSIQTSKTV